jgi:hypothetical protein
LQDIGLFAVTESQYTEDENDDEDDSKFRNLGSINIDTDDSESRKTVSMLIGRATPDRAGARPYRT